MSTELERIAYLPYDKSDTGYDELDIVIGELIVDSDNGYAWIKIKDGTLVPLRGAGYIELINYIKQTMAIGTEPKDIHSFLLDTKNKIPTEGIPTGLFKVRVVDSVNPANTYFQEIGIVTNGANCVIYTGENDGSGKPITKTVKDLYVDYTQFKVTTNNTLTTHDTRIKSIETEIAQRSKDRKVYYDKFTQSEAGDLVYCITPDNTSTEPANYIFETSVVLGMDNGEAVNRHMLGWHMDYANHRIDSDNCYLRDIGNKVDLAVQFYYKNEKVWVRPTQIDGEFILRDKSPNAGSFTPYTGEVIKMSFSASGLTPNDLVNTLGSANNEEATSWTLYQPNHGFPPMSACYFDTTDNKMKFATLENRAKCIVTKIDSDWLHVHSAGHIKVPEHARADLATVDFESNKMYYLHQTKDGAFDTEYPTFIYQELGYAYMKRGIMWFAINISTPIELMPYTIKNMASKEELRMRQLVTQRVEDIPDLDEPIGTVMTVANRDNWEIRKVEVDRNDEDGESYQLANGLWANVVAVVGKIKDEDLNKKYDKGDYLTGLIKFPNASAIIKFLETVPHIDITSRLKSWEELMIDLERYLPKANVTQDMNSTNTEYVPSSAIFNQLLKLVQDMKNGNIGALVPQENTAVHIQNGILQKTMITIQSNNDILYNPVLFINGEEWSKAYWTFDASTGIITLKAPYSMYSDARYTILDVFPTDVRFIADTAQSILIAPYKNSLKEGDVIKVLGENKKYDGGHHLRIVESTSGLNAIALPNNKYLNEIPYTNVKAYLDRKLDKDKFEIYIKKNSTYVPDANGVQIDTLGGIKFGKVNMATKYEDELTLKFNIQVTKDLLKTQANELKSMDFLRFMINLPDGIDKTKLDFDFADVRVYDRKQNFPQDYWEDNEYSASISGYTGPSSRAVRARKIGFSILYQYIGQVYPLVKYDGVDKRPLYDVNNSIVSDNGRDGTPEYLADMGIRITDAYNNNPAGKNNEALLGGTYGSPNPVEGRSPNHNGMILLIQRYFEGLPISFKDHLGDDHTISITIKIPFKA